MWVRVLLNTDNGVSLGPHMIPMNPRSHYILVSLPRVSLPYYNGPLNYFLLLFKKLITIFIHQLYHFIFMSWQ